MYFNLAHFRKSRSIRFIAGLTFIVFFAWFSLPSYYCESEAFSGDEEDSHEVSNLFKQQDSLDAIQCNPSDKPHEDRHGVEHTSKLFESCDESESDFKDKLTQRGLIELSLISFLNHRISFLTRGPPANYGLTIEAELIRCNRFCTFLI